MKEAQKLYDEAAKDITAKQYGTACPKLKAAQTIVPEHIRTAISLAECYDKLGEPATALETFEGAQALAQKQNNTDKLTEIDTKLAELRPRVPHLTIVVPKEIATLPGMSILRNRIPVAVGQWGKPVAVNPGTYQLEVTAVDKSPWSTSTKIQLGHDTTVEIKPPWNVAPEKTTDKPEKLAEPPQPTTPTGSPLRTLGIVRISLGAVGIGAGAILGGLAISKNDASKENGMCDARNVCNQMGLDLRNESLTFGNASTALIAVGGALAATGVILVAIGGKSKKDKETAETSILVGPTQLGVHGRW